MGGLTGIVLGAGNRGREAYTPMLLERPELGRIVAVAEPDASRRERFARTYDLEADQCADDYHALLARPRLADFALVATPDRQHVEPALLALQRGYHVLLEKPMALDEADCRALVRASEETGRLLQVCHVARYAPLFSRIKQILDSGRIGRVVTIQHSENVSYWHYAHSYCRGSWRNVAASSPMILAKSCHDLDLLHWFAGDVPIAISSHARPTELCDVNRPEGAPLHCIEGCPHSASCPYDAVASYLEARPLLRDIAMTERPRWAGLLLRAAVAGYELARRIPLPAVQQWTQWKGWPVSTITDDASRAGIEQALRTTHYGRCVYRVGDNDQVSSQNVDILFANGVNASFTMHGNSYREGREIRIDGTRATLRGRFHNIEQSLEIADHTSGRIERLAFPPSLGGHGGGDRRLFADFLAAVRGDSIPLTSARESLQSHAMAFAADRAAREGSVVRLDV